MDTDFESDNKMKITICAFDAPNNIDGPSSWIKRLLPWLSDKGVEVRVIFFAANAPDLPVYNYLVTAGIKCKLIFWELFQEEKIIEVLKELRNNTPDVFIANYFPVACTACKWIKDAGIPTIMVVHNDDPFHYSLIEEYAQKSERFLSNVVCVSKSISKSIRGKISPKIVLSTIPCGAPLSKKLVHLPYPANLKVIYAGRIDEKQKQISAVTRAFCLAARQVPGTEYKIYGSGPALDNVLDILKTEGKGLPVEYAGVLESSSILENFLQHHVFVLLSDYEGIPISLMEAMGCGLVPVCTFVKSGIQEMVEDRVNGLLVEDRLNSFVRAIQTIKSDPELHMSMSANAHSTIKNNYASEICNSLWLELLKDTLNPGILKSEIQIPSLSELREYKFPSPLKAHANPMPSPILIPLFRLKYILGKLKRQFLP